MAAKGLDTIAVHGAGAEERIAGAVVLPVFQSSTYLYSGESSYESLRYIRLNNTPNHRSLHGKIAALEGAEAGLVTASGMAAIAAALVSVLSAGDHLLAQRTLYGGTRELLAHELPSLGIECDFIDPCRPETWAERLRDETRAILVESISNPSIEIGDLPAVVRFARENQLVSLIDNTFATPVNFRPIEHGFDLVLHSCSKYLNGHTDLVAGAVAGRREWIEKINRRLLLLGGCLDPHACFLLERGMKTLVLRVERQNASALRIAEYLDRHPSVARVNYPALPSSGGHRESKALFSGYGGMLSFELGGGADAARLALPRLRIPVEAPSLGGVESLVTRPATTSHSALSPAERGELGIRDGLIRLSVGIESVEDLIADLQQALEAD